MRTPMSIVPSHPERTSNPYASPGLPTGRPFYALSLLLPLIIPNPSDQRPDHAPVTTSVAGHSLWTLPPLPSWPGVANVGRRVEKCREMRGEVVAEMNSWSAVKIRRVGTAVSRQFGFVHATS